MQDLLKIILDLILGLFSKKSKELPKEEEPKMSPRKINEEGLELIKRFEGCSLNAYKDSVGIWTIGYGSTTHVYEGMTISQEQADLRLIEDLADAESGVEHLVKVKINDNQFSALVSFTFNLGAGSLGQSTLLKLLNDGQVSDAANQFLRWNRAGGKESVGLTKRRQAEKELFLKPIA